MKVTLLPVPIVLVAFAGGASAEDISGTWKVDFVGGVAWKTIGNAEFEFKVDGDKLGGIAHVGKGCPGTAPISEGTMDGDHISFSVFGQSPSTSGYPKMKFTGSVRGGEMELTMTLFYSDESSGWRSEFKGKKTSR